MLSRFVCRLSGCLALGFVASGQTMATEPNIIPQKTLSAEKDPADQATISWHLKKQDLVITPDFGPVRGQSGHRLLFKGGSLLNHNDQFYKLLIKGQGRQPKSSIEGCFLASPRLTLQGATSGTLQLHADLQIEAVHNLQQKALLDQHKTSPLITIELSASNWPDSLQHSILLADLKPAKTVKKTNKYSNYETLKFIPQSSQALLQTQIEAPPKELTVRYCQAAHIKLYQGTNILLGGFHFTLDQAFPDQP